MKIAKSPFLNVWQNVKVEYAVDGSKGESYAAGEQHYVFTPAEIADLETTSGEIQQMLFEVIDDVIRRNRFAELGVAESYVPFVVRSWREEHPGLLGRMHFAFSNEEPFKLVGYSGENPTGLLEASLQWRWLELYRAQTGARVDQMNSIEPLLLDFWLWYREQMSCDEIHFTSAPEREIDLNILMATARSAGLRATFLPLGQIGLSCEGKFVDVDAKAMTHVYRDYPWHKLFEDTFAPHLLTTDTRWIEPAWKVILSAPQLLALLFEIFPKHPHLTKASAFGHRLGVQSPIVSPKQANVTAAVWMVGETPAGLTVHRSPNWNFNRYTPTFLHLVE